MFRQFSAKVQLIRQGLRGRPPTTFPSVPGAAPTYRLMLMASKWKISENLMSLPRWGRDWNGTSVHIISWKIGKVSMLYQDWKETSMTHNYFTKDWKGKPLKTGLQLQFLPICLSCFFSLSIFFDRHKIITLDTVREAVQMMFLQLTLQRTVIKPMGKHTWLAGKSPRNGRLVGKSSVIMLEHFSIVRFDYQNVIWLFSCAFQNPRRTHRANSKILHTAHMQCMRFGKSTALHSYGFPLDLELANIKTNLRR